MAEPTQEPNSSPAAEATGPRYSKPSVASRLPDYSNASQEAIQAAFMPGSFTTIQSLHNRDPDAAPFRTGKSGASTFTDFAYISSPYDLAEETRIRDRLDHESRIVGAQPFFSGYNASTALQELDVSYDHLFDPYDGPRDAQRLERREAEARQLGRPFVPPGVQKALERPTRSMLNDAMTGLYRTLVEDWAEAPPTVLSTAEDLIVAYFSLEKVRHDTGVLTYMNNLARRGEVVQQYDLRKMQGAWNLKTGDGHLMFTFRPPWVRPQVVAEVSPGPVPSSAAESPATE